MRAFYSDNNLRIFCKEFGHTFISRIEGVSNSVVLMKCGHVQTLKESSIKENSHTCTFCRENKNIENAEKAGLTYLSQCKESAVHGYYKYSCGHDHRIKHETARKDTKKQCSLCRIPRDVYLKNYRQENHERLDRLTKEWVKDNIEHVRSRRKQHYLSNKDRLRAQGKQHYIENKSTYLHYSKLRKLAQKKRTPPWLTKEHKQEILSFYKTAKELQTITGVDYHVDHIVPLCGKTVCGLHVPWNLQVIEGSINLSKSNLLLDEYLELSVEEINKAIKELNV